VIAEDLEDLDVVSKTHPDVHIATSALKSNNDSKRKRKSRSGSMIPSNMKKEAVESPSTKRTLLPPLDLKSGSENGSGTGAGVGQVHPSSPPPTRPPQDMVSQQVRWPDEGMLDLTLTLTLTLIGGGQMKACSTCVMNISWTTPAATLLRIRIQSSMYWRRQG